MKIVDAPLLLGAHHLVGIEGGGKIGAAPPRPSPGTSHATWQA